MDKIEKLEPLKKIETVVYGGEGPYQRPELLCDEFKKFDEGKPKFSNLPQLALLEVVKSFQHGQVKYGAFNYSNSTDYLRYYDACQRHLHSWMIGKDVDEDSGNLHLANAIASLLMLLDGIKTGKAIDNRNKVYNEL